MASEFGELLKRRLQRLDLSLLGFAERVGKSQGNLSNIIKGGDYRPPVDQLELWADKLELKGRDRDEFLETAYLEHCPEPIRKEYLRQKMLISKMDERLSRLEKR